MICRREIAMVQVQALIAMVYGWGTNIKVDSENDCTCTTKTALTYMFLGFM
jgi:hypothetical protein